MVTCHAGCAVTAGAQVGLDVEETQRHTHGDPLRLARRRFSPKEIASLEGGPLDSSLTIQGTDSRHVTRECPISGKPSTEQARVCGTPAASEECRHGGYCSLSHLVLVARIK